MEVSEAIDIHFFKPNKKRSSKEAEVENHLKEKQQRVDVTEARPKLGSAYVFRELFKCCPKAAVFSVLPDYIQDHQTHSDSSTAAEEPSLPLPLTDLYDSNSKTMSMADLEQACAHAMQSIVVSQDQADYLERSTVNQSRCLTWFEHRKGRITASHFYDAYRHIDSNSKTYPKSIISSIMQYGSDISHVPAIKWGREKEDQARKAYATQISLQHEGTCVRCCGLVVSPSYPYLGSSPDGMVTCTCCDESVLLEIKCPYKYRDQLPTADVALADPGFCLKRNANNEVHLSESHKYYFQVQGQIALCNVTHCDFVCWTNEGIFVERIAKDELLLSNMLPQLRQFFENYMLPELLTHNLQLGHSDKENQVICACRKPESGKMIGCDNPKCSIAWFHYKCVGIKRAPRGKWYCPNCKK